MLEPMKPKVTKGPRKPAAKSVRPLAASAAPHKSKADIAASTAAKAKRTSRVPRLKIPPILLEGDAPPTQAASGPGQRYALGPTPAAAPTVAASAELPESYGTQQLFLAARDPHWLYAHWDFSREQLKKYNALAEDGHLGLRVYRGAAEGEPLAQIHLHPESRTWFVPVPAAGAKYLAELGYHDPARKWVLLARSGATFTPPDSLSDDTSVRFATIPPEVPFTALLAMVKGAVREHVPLVEAMQQMRAQGFRDLPTPEEVKHEWTPAQEQALAEVISIDHMRRIDPAPATTTGFLRRRGAVQPAILGHGRRRRALQRFQPVRRRGTVARFLVQRQRRIDYLWRDGAGRHGHHRRSPHQTSSRRLLQFPLCAAGRPIFLAGGGAFGRWRGDAPGALAIQQGDSLSRGSWSASAR